jgi:class 3 adenylate cyclase/predicted ATPase
MFCDLVDSTVLAERLDPEELRELVHDYHRLCARAIGSHGGNLAQYLGDGVLAYFGYPVAREHDAGAAVRAGLAIVRAMAESPGDHKVRVGIHSGLVVTGEMDSRDQRSQLPVGSTVNIAARIQGVAPPNTVVISAATQRLTRGFYETRDLGTPPMKGVSSPIRVYEVVSESGAQSAIEAAMSAGLTPLVGRDKERSVLFERWEQARGGAGQVVFVSGDAGIGKSRLMQDLKEHLEKEAHRSLECRCSPHHENSALYPAIDLLRRVAELERAEDAGERFERLEQTLAPYASEIPDAVPLIAALLSVPLPDGRPPLNVTPQRQRQRTMEALAAILLEMTREQPLLLIVEDLHWIDPSSLEFLGLLLEQAPVARILVVLLFRPSFVPTWREISPTEIELTRLTIEEASEVVRAVAGGSDLPPEVVRELSNRADGVPLYLEELTKTMLESGQLQERDGRYELAGPLAALEIPSTLQESLMARLDRLSHLKEVVQLSATIGRAFSYELIRSVARLDDATLQDELARLVDAEVLNATGTPPHTNYVFKHALIQEAAYEALLRNKRRDYHRQIAETLKASFPQIVETQPELLGHHWAGAGLPGDAVTYYQLAGRRAIERSADTEAASHLARALDLLGELDAGPERTRRELELLINLGVALVATKGFTAPEVEQVYARARELCDEVGETTHLYNALSGIFLFHQARGELQTALELTHQRLHVAERLEDEALVMQVHENLGTLAFWRGDFKTALPSLEEALSRYDADRARELALVYGTESGVVCETYAAQVLWFLGYPDRAVQRCQQSVERARALGHANSLGLALAFAAAMYHIRREPERTQVFADETVAFSTEQQLPFWQGFGMIFQGLSQAGQGRAQEGIDRMLAGVASFQQTGAGLGGPFCLAMLAEAHLRAGRADEGLGLLVGGLQLVGEHEDVFFDGEVSRVKGCLLLEASSGDPKEAERCLLEALERARSQEARMLELRAATSLARLWQRDEPERAREVLAGAYGALDEGFDLQDLREAAKLLAALP